ncbi:MAG: PQQ-binding-like beta-propeller repeat protein [Planctomycetaceae bacterium]|nr:PQQ-binding-like beta-propeller repeat protein [Planctomycetaceae bacterium]
MMRSYSWGFVWLMCVFPLALPAAEEWSQFRGPTGEGHAPTTARLPLTWSETENIKWKVAVPGEGYSSPVISGNQLWLTTAIVAQLSEEEEAEKLAKLTTNPRGIKFGGALTLRALCFDVRHGELLHDVTCFQYPAANPKHATNTYASPTPVIHEGKVLCHFGEYGTCGIDAATGTVLWRNQEFRIDHQNGPGSSPVVWGNLLIVHFDGTDKQFVAAYDLETGAVAWQTPRTAVMPERPEFKKAYCTPLILTVNGQDQLISPASDWVYAYEPATGKEIWRANYGQLGFSTVPRPVSGHGMVYVCTSFMKSRLLAVKYDGQGDVTASHVVWHSDRQVPQKPSLILVGQELYFTSDGGIATCLDALTGEQIWQERLRGQYSASPLHASGRIYLFNHEGQCTVLKPGRQVEILAENVLDAGAMASPAVLGNALFVRTTTHLYRIE